MTPYTSMHDARLPAWMVVGLVVGMMAGPAVARIDPPCDGREAAYQADGIHIIDGSFVLSVNELHVNITNHGLIGSQFSEAFTYSHAPSAQWPAGSGVEYLWSGGLWIGGVLQETVRVSTGQYDREFRPERDIWATMYEARDMTLVRPAGLNSSGGYRIPHADADDDHDGRVDEETLNGKDDDGDGKIDEDFGQIGDQMIVCTMYDNTPLARELYPDHEPLDLEVIQTASAFSGNDFKNFIVLRYKITNVGAGDIEDLKVGFFADCDIGPRGRNALGKDDGVGYFEGVVRSSNDSWSFLKVGYMYDMGNDPVPGYFGVTGLGRTDFQTFRRFTGNRGFEAGGLPLNDQQRFEAMTRMQYLYGINDVEPADYSFLVSRSARSVLASRQSYSFDLALVMGKSLGDMLENCANADVAKVGAYFDIDGDASTGTLGRETHLCFEQVPPNWHSIYTQTAMHMQDSCIGDRSIYEPIRPGDFVQNEYGLYCLWVNMDNCEECTRQTGIDCTNDPILFWSRWNCRKPWLVPAERIGCTGIAGRETAVPWYDLRVPPPSPGVRVWPQDNSVHVFWSDESEYAWDMEMEMVDFEAYRIWRADNWGRPLGTSTVTGPGTDSWQMLAEFDIVDEMVIRTGNGVNDTVPLGLNTGLEVAAYAPACLDDPTFEGLAAAMQDVVDKDVDGQYTERPVLRDRNGVPLPGLQSLLPWETYPDVLDTFFNVTARAGAAGVTPKRGRRYYEYVDRELHNGFLYFYSVTATDRRIKVENSQPFNLGYGLTGSPNASFAFAIPSTDAQTAQERREYGANIYVYPNPATIESLADFQQFEPARNDPTGVRIAFANLPEARNRIRIYTASGDLIEELYHDGTGGYGQMSWNLVSRNGQEIVSGIYLYTVESDGDGFGDFTGRFVVVR